MTSVESFWVSILDMHSTYLHGKRERLPNEPEPIRVQPEKNLGNRKTLEQCRNRITTQDKSLSCREQIKNGLFRKDRDKKLSIRRQLTKTVKSLEDAMKLRLRTDQKWSVQERSR